MRGVLGPVADRGVAAVVGNFEVVTEDQGWSSRGTLVAKREAQNDLLSRKTFPWYSPPQEDNSNGNERRRLHFSHEEGHGDGPHDDGPETDEAREAREREEREREEREREEREREEREREEREREDREREERERREDEERDRERLAREHTNNLVVVWEAEGGDVLQPEALTEICEIEQRLTALPGYGDRGRGSACARGYDENMDPTDCMPVQGVPAMIRAAAVEGLLKDADGNTLDGASWRGCADMIAEGLPGILAWASQCADRYSRGGHAELHRHAEGEENTCGRFPPSLFGEGFSSGNPVSGLTTTLFPVQGEETGGSLGLDWMYALHEDGTLEEVLKGTHVRGYYNDEREKIQEKYMDSLLMADMMLSASAAVIIFVLLGIHTQSIFLTVVALLQVGLSFPTAFFLYKLVLNLKYFPFLNFMGMFVILGIGADDIFVLFDKWEQTEEIMGRDAPTEDIAAVAIPEAAFAMLLTTSTTAAAFFATIVAPVAPVRVFAIFMGLLVICDYIWNITIFGAAVAYRHRALRAMRLSSDDAGCRSGLCRFLLDSRLRCLRKSRKPALEGGDGTGQKAHLDDDSLSPWTVEGFFTKPFFKTVRATRWLSIVLFVGLIGVTAYYSTKIEAPKTSRVQLLPSDSNFERMDTLKSNGFMNSNEGNSGWVSVVWGLVPEDNGNHNDPKDRTSMVLNEEFDLALDGNQMWLWDFCNRTAAQDFVPSTQNPSCFLADFDSWLKYDSHHRVENCGPDAASGVPVAPVYLASCLEEFLQERDDDTVPPQVIHDGRVRAVRLAFPTGIRWDAPLSVTAELWDRWEAHIAAEAANAPPGMGGFFHTSGSFNFWDTNTSLRRAAYSAAVIAIGVAAVVLLVGTGNYIITLYATISIFGVLTCVGATIYGMGWKLGFLEAVCFAILIGLSVDFIIHFAHMYCHAPHEDRRDRTRHALRYMSVPVLSAGLTTFASSVLLFICKIVFFNKFGVVLMLTILYSLLITFYFFNGLNAAVGPNGTSGRIFCRGDEGKASAGESPYGADSPSAS